MGPKAEDNPVSDRIFLPAELAAMERLPPWIERLAKARDLDERTRYAIHLCLEEAISNIVRHGYAGDESVPQVMVACSESSDGWLTFTVEDHAPAFNPLTVPQPPLLEKQGEIPVGGHGLGLLRGFSDSLSYESIPDGNRLQIGFMIRRPNNSAK